MHAVLYTYQLEPITVVDIPMELWGRLMRGDTVGFAVMKPLSMEALKDRESATVEFRLVEIFGERLVRRGHEMLMLFTRDEESALLLRAEFLPGQRGELHNRERSAFASGFLQALQGFGSQPEREDDDD